ncbi:hypothetical protein MYU51_007933 [Penicillium brevicompactum]|uniref:uncharacterized protein n=1 Tax=Penicillium brevicompactum TaxID=5074 RepID=UPI00253FB2FE|nr:uncharacterized protein N7506_001238 [Penicillium brevicompactum]KAJ5347985.1 hypothetical protein N7506_001238 [Penicillium brevicompactum]
MKTTSITTIALAVAGSALAADTAALKPLELTNLHAGIYYTSRPTTTLFSFSLKDPNSNTETTCSGYWSAGQPGAKSYDCSDKSYQLHLINGVYNIENFDIGVSRVDGTVTGQSTVTGEPWKCKKQESPMEQCEWDGVFNLEVAPLS